jgi:predicted NBD/HSP70 family sugar kinase
MTRSLIDEIEKGHKTAIIKRNIIMYYIYHETSTIPELSKELNLSIPTVSKFVNDMCVDGILIDHGKLDSHSGRRPFIYGLNPKSGYFMGVDIYPNIFNIGLVDFAGNSVLQEFGISYSASYGTEEAINQICQAIEDCLKKSDISLDRLINACFNISGRVNPSSGYSYSCFNFLEKPLSDILAEKLGVHICIQNDTRSMTYGEFLRGSACGKENALFVNLSWGLGLGIIINGQVYRGKSGFAGEFGHVNVFDNEIMCHCGKKGCLETEVSGNALHRQLLEQLADGKNSVLLEKYRHDNSSITLDDIINATQKEDLLCIELIEEIGNKLGKQLAGLINIFNPELVIIGGTLAVAEEYIMQPIRQAVRKYSLNLVNRDSNIVCSKLGDKASLIGACLYARSMAFEHTNA